MTMMISPIQQTFDVIQQTFGAIQGTFGAIQGTFGAIQGTFGGLAVHIRRLPQERRPWPCSQHPLHIG
jgi:hypothetical protein